MSGSYDLTDLLITTNDLLGSPGVYDVEVTAPGYKPWRLKRVRPIVSDCDQIVGRVFPAWLIPTS